MSTQSLRGADYKVEPGLSPSLPHLSRAGLGIFAVVLTCLLFCCSCANSSVPRSKPCVPTDELRNATMLEIDSRGDLYISEAGVENKSARLLKYTLSSKKMCVLLDGYERLYGLEFDESERYLYFADVGNNQVSRYDTQTDKVEVVAGTGEAGFAGDGSPAKVAQLDSPYDIAFDNAAGLIIADTDNNRIRRLDMNTGLINTIAGNGEYAYKGDNGPAITASLARPHNVLPLPNGDLVIGDSWNNRIRVISAGDNTISLLAGNGVRESAGDGGPLENASFMFFGDILVEQDGSILFTEFGGAKIRRINSTNNTIERVAGTGEKGFSGDGGPSIKASLHAPTGIVYDASDRILFMDTYNSRLRMIDPKTAIITTVFSGTQ